MPPHEDSEIVPIRVQRVPQSVETPVTFVSAPNAYVRYAYSRSGDSMASRIEGQDYLCFQHNDQRFVFVVCDGVGSSFCGNLAARILGDGLLEWLWSVDITYLGGAAALSEAAASALNRLQKRSRHEVDEYHIPDHLSPLVRQALEAQRAYGSESVFVALRIDHPCPTIPDGLISLCWMGDSQLRLYDEESGEIDIGGAWDNANRWSTTQGTRGQMSAWMRELTGIGRIIAFTDGLSAHAKAVMSYSDDQLDRQIRAGAKLPTSDDVAIIDVTLRTPLYEGYPDPETPDLNLERPALEPIWNPAGSGVYELRWSWPGQSNASFMIQEATNPALTDAKALNAVSKDLAWKPEKPQAPGLYYYRTRAITRRGVATPWSELRQTRVAYPPPPAPTLSLVEAGPTPTLSWETQGEALDVTLEYSRDPSFEEPETVYSGRSSSWTAPPGSLPPGEYHFRAQAHSDGGASPWSDAQKVIITLPPPPKPHLATASAPLGAGGRSVEMRWQAVPGATHYELEQHELGSDQLETFTTIDSIHRLDDLEEGQYVYRVRACHASGCSEWSNEQTVSVSAQPPAALGALAVDGPDEAGAIRLAWGEVERAAGYEVEVSADGAFRNARVIPAEAPPVEIVRREAGEAHFRARAINAGGAGGWSAPARVAIAPLTPDWIEARQKDDGALAISWASAGGHAAYALEWSADGAEASFAEIYRGEDTQHVFKPAVVPPRGAAIRVRAEAGGVASAWQTARIAGGDIRLGAPVLEAIVNDTEGILLKWNAVAGASHYVIEAARDERFSTIHPQETHKTAATFNAPTSGRYWIRARAAQGNALGEASNIVTVDARQPAAPRIWPVDPVKERALFDVAWTGVPGCLYYELQGSPDAQFEVGRTSAVRVNHPSQRFTVQGQGRGVYHYRVRAFDENGQASPWSAPIAVEVG